MSEPMTWDELTPKERRLVEAYRRFDAAGQRALLEFVTLIGNDGLSIDTDRGIRLWITRRANELRRRIYDGFDLGGGCDSVIAFPKQ